MKSFIIIITFLILCSCSEHGNNRNEVFRLQLLNGNYSSVEYIGEGTKQKLEHIISKGDINSYLESSDPKPGDGKADFCIIFESKKDKITLRIQKTDDLKFKILGYYTK